MFSVFCSIINEAVEAIAPRKKFRLKKRPNLPWFDKELFYLSTKRVIAHHLAILSKTNHDSPEWVTFREARNKCKSSMRLKMIEYFKDKDISFLIVPKAIGAFINQLSRLGKIHLNPKLLV